MSVEIPHLPRIALLLVAIGCTPSGGGGRAKGATSADARVSDAAKAPISQTAYDEHGEPTMPTAWQVHEWGVLAVAGAQLDRGKLVAGPVGSADGRTAPQGRKRKPVLYVHLGKGVDSVDFSLEVAPPQGRIVEHWPRTAPSSAAVPSVAWKQVRARFGACDGKSFQYPPLGSPECATEDGVCEVAELATVETPDGVCLDFEGATYEHLFYRADLDALELGIALARQPSGEWHLENHRGEPLAAALRVTTRGPGAPATIDRVDAVAAGAHALLPASATGASGIDFAGARALLERGLVERGLTSDEAGAFLRAWQVDLLGSPPADVARAAVPSRDASRRSNRAGSDLLLIWLDRATVDALVPLTISPPPSALHRVHLLVVELPPG